MIYTAKYLRKEKGIARVIKSKEGIPYDHEYEVKLCLVDENEKPIAEILTPGIKVGQKFHEREVNFLTLD